MQVPLEITFRNMESSPTLEARAHKLAQQLEKFSAQIIHCHVIIEAPHRRHSQGKLFQAVLSITVPGSEIAIQRTGPADHSHEDPYVALRDAFKAARRRLQDYERKRRGDKAHSERHRQQAAKTANTHTRLGCTMTDRLLRHRSICNSTAGSTKPMQPGT